MAGIATQLTALDRMLRRIVRGVRRLAVAGALGIAPIALLLRRDDGLNGLDVLVIIVLLAAPAIVLFFAQGVLEIVALPERLRRIPGEGQERLSELSRLAGEARTARVRHAPLLVWRLRGTIGSLRDIAGIALPLRVLTPGFIGLAALAALACVALAGAGLISLLVLAVG